ncbi:MAG TPA: hypothetical protein VFK15_05200 [Burkholderiales bacterium]|nr:hypothetical protein [Burkholderiales bacterium]
MSGALDFLGRKMAAYNDELRTLLKGQWAVTIVLRHKADPHAHVLLGDDDLEGIAQFVSEMAAAPDKRIAIANADHVSEFQTWNGGDQ